MQAFLLGYILVSVCGIFTVGGFPLKASIYQDSKGTSSLLIHTSHANLSLKAFTGITPGCYCYRILVLLFNSFVGYQVLDDGTPTPISFLAVSGLALFIGTAYIALDTGYGWTGHFDSSLGGQNRNIALYVLYQLVPLVFVVAFFCFWGDHHRTKGATSTKAHEYLHFYRPTRTFIPCLHHL